MIANPKPFSDYIARFAAGLREDLPTPLIDAPIPDAAHWPERSAGKKCALLLTPHPDDECLTGALPLRLKEENGWQIINVAVTLGSKEERKEARLKELTASCVTLGFDLLLPEPLGMARISPETRDQSEILWNRKVERIAEIIARLKPDAIILPNLRDGHRTHVGTYYLGMDALGSLGTDFSCQLMQTEYWQPNALPNLMIGINETMATKLLMALSCHAGEVARNPFHKLFPSYLADNARRGSERVGGKGVAGAAFLFAMLYQCDHWHQGRIKAVTEKYIFGPDQKIGLD